MARHRTRWPHAFLGEFMKPIVSKHPTRNKEALIDLKVAFQHFQKWDTYGIAFKLMDQRKVRLIDIKDAAWQVGIKPGVISMRRIDWRKGRTGVNL